MNSFTPTLHDSLIEKRMSDWPNGPIYNPNTVVMALHLLGRNILDLGLRKLAVTIT